MHAHPFEDTILTVREVADFLKVSQTTIYRLANSGELPARKVGGAWRFSRMALRGWMHDPKERDPQLLGDNRRFYAADK